MKRKFSGLSAFAALVVLAAPSAFCDSLVANQWYAIQWNGGIGSPVFNAPGYVGSAGTVLDNPGASSWTYTAGASGAELIVTDLFIDGDQFNVFNGATGLGITSVPANDGHTCGNDPIVCLQDPLLSHGYFFLSPGLSTISMTMFAEANGFTSGGAAFEIFTPNGATPEPGAAGLFLLGAAGLLAARRRLLRR